MIRLLTILLIAIFIIPSYASAYIVNKRILFDKSVSANSDGTNPTGNWLIDRIAGNSWVGTVPSQGAAKEAGGINKALKAVETPEGIYIVSGELAHADNQLLLVQGGMLRILMESEGDYVGPIEMCRAGYPAWSSSDHTLYLTGPNCLRKIVEGTNGQRTVELVAGECGVSGTADGALGTGKLQRNTGLTATSDGIIYWLETGALRKIDGGTISTVSLTWTGLYPEPSPFWGRSGLNDDGLSLGPTDDILYVHDYYDSTYGNGVFKVDLTGGANTITKALRANSISNQYWVDYDAANGTNYSSYNENDGGPLLEFTGLSAGRYNKFYNSILVEYNDTQHFRWYNLDDDTNVTTIFGTPTGRDANGDLTGEPTINTGLLNSLGIDGERFLKSYTRVVGDGKGEGVYVNIGYDDGLYRAYDQSLTTEGGSTFPDQFPDTSASSSRDGRVKAAIVTPGGTFLNTSFAVSSLTSGVQSQPKVAYLGGTYLVVWSELGTDNTGFNVYGMRVSNTGSIIGSKLEIAAGLRTQNMPDVAANATGFVVVWGGFDSATTYANDSISYVFSRTVSLSGALGSVNTVTEGAIPEISWNATAGEFLVVAGSSSSSSLSRRILWVRLNSDGTAMADVETYPWFYISRSKQYFSVGALPDDGAASQGWTFILDQDAPDRHNNSYGIYRAFTIDPDGYYDFPTDYASYGATPPNKQNSPTPTPSWWLEYSNDLTDEWPRGPSAIATDSEYAIAVWQRYDQVGIDKLEMQNSNLYIGRLDKTDLVETAGVNLAVTSDSERNASIAGDGAGNLVVVYEKILDGERQIASASVDVATSITVNAENILVSESLDSDLWRGYPDIAYNGTDDEYLMVWQEGAEGLNAYIAASFNESTILTQDGWATPEQIAIFLPDDSFPDSMTATMRYRNADVYTWTEGHDLYHITDWGGKLTSGNLEPGFAWVITGLEQGTEYVVEVTTHDGATDVVETKTMETSSLAPAAGAVTTTIAAGSTESQIETIFSNASAGDVIQFENGTYSTTGLTFQNDNGTEAEPIYVRGESRDGVIISDSSGIVFYFLHSHNVVLENLTLQGSGVDNGTSASDRGVQYTSSSDPLLGNITLRYLTVKGVDYGFYTDSAGKQFVVYENIFEGHHTWGQDVYTLLGRCNNGCTEEDTYLSGPPGEPDGTRDQDEGVFYNDVGIKWGGSSNVAFNNTFSGFGDTMKVGSGAPGDSIHFYRNNVNPGGDDGVEADDGRRNITAYDNRFTNTQTCMSVDSFGEGGPFIAFRNICINVARQVWKLNASPAAGIFLYNNTVVHKFRNNPIRDDYNFIVDGKWQNWFGYQNNILIYQDSPVLYLSYLSQIGLADIDYTNNSFYPDGKLNWNMSDIGTFDDLADAKANIRATTPVFSGDTQRHTDDLISELQPFETEVILGSDYNTEVTIDYTPTLTANGVSDDTGIVIVGVTDGYDGSAPDRGAIISGRSVVTYGATASGDGNGSGIQTGGNSTMTLGGSSTITFN